MLRKAFMLSLALGFAGAMAGCDTVTDLSEVTVDGVWYSAGPLQASLGETNTNLIVVLGPEESGGFNGSWRLGGSAAGVRNGSNDDGQVQFTLEGFNGQDPVFSGEFTREGRLAGELIGYPLDGSAVFLFCGQLPPPGEQPQC